MGKKVWEVSHEPFACRARYKYEAHAESGTESPHPPVVAAAADLTAPTDLTPYVPQD